MAFNDVDDCEEHISGISPAQLADLRTVLRENDLRFLQIEMECISEVSKADCLIVNSVEGLEAEAIGSLRAMLHFPIYPIAFPYFKPEANHLVSYSDYKFDYLNWLDSQAAMSVLYISLGSFLSVSCAQMNEIVSALETSGVRYLWVVRGEVSWLKEKCGDRGIVVPWCDQLKVLSHPSVGGFWTHCGWNSTMEAVFAGIPMLTFPLFFDQVPNSRQILEVWKNGWELKRSVLGSEEFIAQKEILEVIGKFMDVVKGKELRERVLELKGICDQAVAEGGSSNINLNALMKDVLCVQGIYA